MIIGVADNMGSEQKYQLYLEWLRCGRGDIEFVKLSYRENNRAELARCAGLLLTGGGDVDPAAYGACAHPKTHGIDTARDSFERSLIDAALEEDMPLLGICRGLQIANVHFGGSLIQDLHEAGYPGHDFAAGEAVKMHEVIVSQKSLLADILGGESAGTVNSYHHQAVDTPGTGLHVVARSGDGVIEALEYRPARSFFLLLQWHPERMKGEGNHVSSPIVQKFLAACVLSTSIRT